MQLVYFSPCIWRWIFWYREWSEIENFITISSIKISIIREYACWHNTNARWQISSFRLNGHWKFGSMKALHVRILRSSFILVCHMCQVNQVDCVDFWWIFEYHSLVGILNISTSSLPLKLGGGEEVHFRLLSIRALVLKKVNCFLEQLTFLVWTSQTL